MALGSSDRMRDDGFKLHRGGSRWILGRISPRRSGEALV